MWACSVCCAQKAAALRGMRCSGGGSGAACAGCKAGALLMTRDVSHLVCHARRYGGRRAPRGRGLSGGGRRGDGSGGSGGRARRAAARGRAVAAAQRSRLHGLREGLDDTSTATLAPLAQRQARPKRRAVRAKSGQPSAGAKRHAETLARSQAPRHGCQFGGVAVAVLGCDLARRRCGAVRGCKQLHHAGGVVWLRLINLGSDLCRLGASRIAGARGPPCLAGLRRPRSCTLRRCLRLAGRRPGAAARPWCCGSASLAQVSYTPLAARRAELTPQISRRRHSRPPLDRPPPDLHSPARLRPL